MLMCLASSRHLLRGNAASINQFPISAWRQSASRSRPTITATTGQHDYFATAAAYAVSKLLAGIPRLTSRSSFRRASTQAQDAAVSSSTAAGQGTAAAQALGAAAPTVGKSAAAGAAVRASAPASGGHAKKIVARWLIGCAGMALGTVLLSGASRLAGSGLSVVEWNWNPLKYLALYPRTDPEWEARFERYKALPDYKYQSEEKEGGLTLDDFRRMYRVECAHRLWTRAMVLSFFLPGIVFLAKGWVPPSLKPRLVMHAGTLGLQGWLGYKALQSGLREPAGQYDVPRMSSYLVSAHLLSTLSLYAMFLWQGLAHLHLPQPLASTYRHRRVFMIWSHTIMALTVFTAVSGGVVSTIKAGLVYNSWPKMADRWVPDDLWALGESKWKNAFENTTTAQFIHRCLAHTTVTLACAFWLVTRTAPFRPRARLAAHCLLGAAVLQLSLGVATLLTLVQSHVAASHQCGSMLLLTVAIWLANELRRIPK